MLLTFGDHDVIRTRNDGLDDRARDAGTVTATVQLKLPPFWPADPDVWFAQIEAQFSITA